MSAYTNFVASNNQVLSGTVSAMKVTAATYPFAPIGTLVEKFSTDVPDDGLHAISFFHQDPTGVSSVLLLIWREGGKLVAQTPTNTPHDCLRLFNRFSKSTTDLSISDAANRILYTDSLTTPTDPTWTHKSVSTETILLYICRRISLAELDTQAQSPFPSYAELLERNTELGYQKDSLEVQLADKEDELSNALRDVQSVSEKLTSVNTQLDLAEMQIDSLRTYTDRMDSQRNEAERVYTLYHAKTGAMLPLLRLLEKFPQRALPVAARSFIAAMNELKRT